MASRPPSPDRLERLRRHQHALVELEPQFLPLLVCVLLPVILLPVTALPLPGVRWLLPVLLTLLMVQSLRALPRRAPERQGRWLSRLHRGIARLAIALLWLQTLPGIHAPRGPLRFAVLLLSGLFSLLASLRLVGVLARVPRVNPQVLAGAAAGYVYLGVTGGLIAAAVQVTVPGTFRLGALHSGDLLVDRLTYFSFVTLAGLGIGDVVPATPLGERFVILLSLAGTLYLGVLMGLLIGRYIATQEVELQVDALVDEQQDATSPIARLLAEEEERHAGPGGERTGGSRSDGVQ